MTDTTEREQDEEIGWALLEILGHRRLGGFVRVEEIAGTSFFRIDVPAANGHAAFTSWYHPNSLYCLTPVTEAVALSIAKSSPQPATRWELTAIEATARVDYREDAEEPDPRFERDEDTEDYPF